MAESRTYVVAGSKPWNRRVFERRLRQLPGQWHFVGAREELTAARLDELAPRYVFFLHWSWRVPDEIVARFECVNFHMTDLPFGRGGSPLQNLIERGQRQTRLSAFRMVAEMDAGPIYRKADLSLEGGAEEIYLRANELSADLIAEIVRDEPSPLEQSGPVVAFRRRRPEQSLVPPKEDLRALFDFVRMLDAEGYPRAFIVHHGFRYELSRPALRDGRIVADVEITPTEEERQ